MIAADQIHGMVYTAQSQKISLPVLVQKGASTLTQVAEMVFTVPEAVLFAGICPSLQGLSTRVSRTKSAATLRLLRYYQHTSEPYSSFDCIPAHRCQSAAKCTSTRCIRGYFHKRPLCDSSRLDRISSAARGKTSGACFRRRVSPFYLSSLRKSSPTFIHKTYPQRVISQHIACNTSTGRHTRIPRVTVAPLRYRS
jgi:hypothetical protein